MLELFEFENKLNKEKEEKLSLQKKNDTLWEYNKKLEF